MSALTFYNTLKSTLDSNSYRELPDLMNIDEVKESHAHKGYVLQPIGSKENEQNQCLLTEHNWKLEIVYKSKNASDRVSNYDLFQAIKETLYKLTDFKGFVSQPKFNRLSNFTRISVGTLEFCYGIEGS